MNWSRSSTRASVACGSRCHSRTAPASAASTAAPKRVADRGVERGILAEPLGASRVRRRAEPEVEDLSARGVMGFAIVAARALGSPAAPASSPAPADAHILPRYLPARLLPGAAAHQCVGPHLMNGLVGYALAETKSLATARRDVLRAGLGAGDDAGVAVDGARRAPDGFMAGALINVAGCALAVLAIGSRQFRALLCRDRRDGRLQRDRAAVPVRGGRGRRARGPGEGDLAGAGRRRRRRLSRSVSTHVTRGPLPDAVPRRFVGSPPRALRPRRAVAPARSRADVGRARGGGRPLADIMRQPVFVVAALSAAIGYGLMNLLMMATPLAMSFCGHSFGAARWCSSGTSPECTRPASSPGR